MRLSFDEIILLIALFKIKTSKPVSITKIIARAESLYPKYYGLYLSAQCSLVQKGLFRTSDTYGHEVCFSFVGLWRAYVEATNAGKV